MADRLSRALLAPDDRVLEIDARGGAIDLEAATAHAGWKRAGLVRIDVAGRELDALAHLAPLLGTDDAPPLVVHVDGAALGSRRTSALHLLDAVRKLGYATFLIEPVEPGRLRPLTHADFLPAVVADVVGFKATRPLPEGWKWAPPLTEDEVVERLLRICVHPLAPWRAEGARLVREVPAGLAAHRAIRVVASALRDDPDPAVRMAAGG
jgi:hypothetical protein